MLTDKDLEISNEKNKNKIPSWEVFNINKQFQFQNIVIRVIITDKKYIHMYVNLCKREA